LAGGNASVVKRGAVGVADEKRNWAKTTHRTHSPNEYNYNDKQSE